MKKQSYSNRDVSILAIDAGGTLFKSALIGTDGNLVDGSFHTVGVDWQGPRESILSTYCEAISFSRDYAESNRLQIAGMSVATPGPFDISHGQSLMTHKFRSLYKLDLAQAIRDLARLPGSFDIRFVSDANAFIMGENWKGIARGFGNVVGVTLGTGLGFSCLIGGELQINSLGGPRFSLFNMKHGDGVLEDRISSRGIINAYKRLIKTDVPVDLNVKMLARMAVGNDREAALIFKETGEILLDYLGPICNALKIECIVFGGRISRAFDLINLNLRDSRRCIPSLKRIDQAADIDKSALFGATRLFLTEQSLAVLI